jgi:hypothetical protein
MTRTHPKYQRIYINGYDLSGYTRSLGNMGVKFDEGIDAALTDAVKNAILGRATIQAGPLNAFLAPEATPTIGAHELLSAGHGTFNLMAVYGTPGGPNIGDPIIAAQMEEGEYTSSSGDGFSAVNVTFPNASAQGPKNYPSPWGVLVHAKATRTAVNAAVGTIDAGEDTTKGGIFVYQLFSSNGTVTLSIDDSATNLNDTAFAALSGATSGSINASVTPKSGMVQLGVTATVRRYLRWQIALGTATTCVFALGFIRGY